MHFCVVINWEWFQICIRSRLDFVELRCSGIWTSFWVTQKFSKGSRLNAHEKGYRRFRPAFFYSIFCSMKSLSHKNIDQLKQTSTQNLPYLVKVMVINPVLCFAIHYISMQKYFAQKLDQDVDHTEKSKIYVKNCFICWYSKFLCL